MRRGVLCLLACLCVPAAAGGASRAAPSPRLTDSHSCPETPGFTCSTLTVPLDHAGAAPGTLDLAVAAANGGDKAPRDVLVVLTGGPGQPGAAFVPRVLQWLGPVADHYRLVMLDQRGTGAGALRCPALQAAMGSSDLTVPAPAAVQSCATAIGPRRRFFTSAATVEDLDWLRQALGVERLALDGISYGTYVAERYALAHPDRVSRLVLDSVVPHDGSGVALYTASMTRSATVLRGVCRTYHCPSDPAADLAAVVRRDHDGPAVLDAIVALSVVDPTYGGVPEALRAARQGNREELRRLIQAVHDGEATPAEGLSQGLHASTLCGDLPFPWGRSAAPVSGRATALRRVGERLRTADTWPFDRATATGNGIVQTCLSWPSTPAPPLRAGGNLPRVPTLLLAGDRDLSTPLPWARWEAAHAPRGTLVVVPGAGHSVQSRAANDAGRLAMRRFLGG